MKKIISVMLVLVMLMLPAALCVSADDDDAPLTSIVFVQLPPDCDAYTVRPLDGYGTYDAERNGVYIVSGGSIAFQVIPGEDASLQMLQVSYYDTYADKNTTIPLEPMKAYDIYTIDGITGDTTVDVDYVLASDRAWLFRSLWEFLRQILDFFARIFGMNTNVA